MGETKKQAGGVSKDQKSNFGPKGWWVIIYAMILFFLGGALVNDGMNIIVPTIAGVNEWGTGILYTMNTVGGWIGIAGAIIFGMVCSKLGAKPTIVISLCLAGASMFFWGRVTSILQYAIIIGLVNVAQNGFMQTGTASLAANWFPTKKGLAMGWMTMGCNLSTAICVRILSGLINNAGLAHAFDIVGIFVLVIALIGVIFVKNNPEDAGAYPDNDKEMTPEKVEKLHRLGLEYEKTSPWTIKKLLTTKIVWLIGVAYGIIIMITMGTISQLVPTIVSYGYTEAFATTMMTVCAVIGMIFSFLFGVLDGKLGTRKASLIFYIWTILALVFMILPQSWTMYPAVFFVGGFVGAGNNLTCSIVATIFGRYDFSKAWTVIFPITVAVRSCGYGIVGVLSERTGAYTVPYIVLIICAAVAFILIFLMDDSLRGRSMVDFDEDAV